MLNTKQLKERLDQLRPPTKRKDIAPTDDFRESMARVVKKELLKADVRRIMIEIENL